MADWFADCAFSAGVPAALVAARDGIDALLRDRGLRRTTPAVTAESLIRGAAASAQIDGSISSLDELRAGAGDATASAAARLSAELLSLVPIANRSPLQALARMHALAAPRDAEPAGVGRPRREPGVAARLQMLARNLVASTTAPAIAVAALAHAEIAVLTPFESANGLVARALERLILVARGVDPASVTVPEAGHLRAGPAYQGALAGYAEGTPFGRRDWLLYAATAITEGAALSPLR
ncbi:MAG: oxidoreductase [Nocardioidaceae bacterium]